MTEPLWAFVAAGLPLLAWSYLVIFHGRFWRADQRVEPLETTPPERTPAVVAVVPARNEADVVAETVRSLLVQKPNGLDVVMVDDHSDDGTANAARSGAAEAVSQSERCGTLHIVASAPRPAGWTGKLWAVSQGITAAVERYPDVPYLLLTDADIAHHPGNLAALLDKAARTNSALTSEMVMLHCARPWERLLIPAFVFFFQKLYPFPLVNDPKRAMAAAAGGCMLVRRDALDQIGGIATIRGALIDDCTLAAAIKPGRAIWLGLTETGARSQRPYEGLGEIWDMVARSAYTQLRYNPMLLLGTLLGMALLYLVPVLALIAPLAFGVTWPAIFGAATLALMLLAYGPTLKLYGLPRAWGLTLPLAGTLYGLMTFSSAWRTWRGQGGRWKGRVAGGTQTGS